ncbi:MAG: choice-of-anchor Q domain-containing protein [Verrucomicrobiota bacterium]
MGARVPSSPDPVPPMVSNGLFSSTNMALYEPSNARGGAIWQKGGKLTILNSRFENNQAKGGADAASSGTCEAFGGAIYMTGGSTVVSNSFFLKNQAIGGNGLAVYQNGQPQGGAIYLSQVSATFEDVSVSENVVTGSGLGFPKGGAIATDGGFLVITNVTLSANQVKGTDYLDRHYGSTSDSSYGGALYNGGTVHVWNSSVLDNLASSGLGDPNNPEFGPPGGHSKGGGVYNEGVIAIYNSTLSGNISQDPSLNFFGYPITNGGLGTAVFSSGFVGVTNSTIADNLIGTEALSSTNTRPFVLKNTILQSNSGKNSGPDIIDAGNNLSSDATPAFSTSTSFNNTDSNLGPLEFYGGATKCYALMAGSPAINGADDATAPATDQRGRTRPFGAHADIGSFESSSPFFVWGQIKGYHDPATKIIVGTNQYEVSAEGYFNIGPFPGGELPLALLGGDALFRPNNWNYNLSVDGPITGIASYQMDSFVPDPVAEGTVFTLAGAPNETWRIEESQDLKSWNTNAVYTLDSTGLLSIEITNYTKAAFFISVKQ